MGIAGQPSGGPTDVADVFSTHLYTGDYGAGTEVNGIDLAGEGGMVWTKARDNNDNHTIIDTEGGGTKWRRSNGYSVEATASNMITSFNSNGYTRGNNGQISDQNYFVSWTFRKKEKFFDIVTWSGNSTAGRQISHGLDGPVGFMICGCTSGATDWSTYNSTDGAGKYNKLNGSYHSISNTNIWNNTAPTSTHFTVGTLGQINETGKTYTAYLFSDNSAEDAEEQMIKCGSYTGNQSATGPVVNLGWEPQWLMVKQTTLVVDPADWIIIDTMRGLNVGGDEKRIYANGTASENGAEICDITPTGFKLTTNSEQTNKNTAQYIYIAIRAPMMVEPKAATDVFAIDNAGSGVVPAYESGFPVDFAIYRDAVGSAGAALASRMTAYYSDGMEMFANNTAPEAATGAVKFDFANGHFNNTSRSANYYSWMWKRAKGFMDVVAYRGTGSAMNLSHSLGAVPELVIIKIRYYSPYPSYGGDKWYVYHKDLGIGSHIALQSASAKVNQGFLSSLPTETNLPLQNTGGDSLATVDSSTTYISYLFATLAGISKVGSFVGNASNNHVINCGFSNGARFVLIKRSSGASQWYLFDSVRGITVGSTDPFIMLNLTNAQQTEAAGLGPDAIQPHSSGFQLTSGGDLNGNSSTYIFYAIA